MANNPYDPSRVEARTSPALATVGSVRTLQIITVAMAMGVTMFAGFALFSNKFALDGAPNTLCWIGCAFAAVMLLLSLIVPRSAVSQGLKNMDSQVLEMDESEQFSKLYPIYQTSHIIACALLEAAAFFNGFLYMMTSFVGSILVVAALVGLILFRFPTVTGASTWVAHRIEDLRLRR